MISQNAPLSRSTRLLSLRNQSAQSCYPRATSLLVAGSIGVALAVSSLGVMLTIIGSICSTSVSFIVPGGCYVALFRERGWGCKRLLALAMLALGIVIAPTCLVLTFLPKRGDGSDDELRMWVGGL